MKPIASMPAMAGATFRPLTKVTERSSLKRSQSLMSNKPQERMRYMARRVPYMAFPGVGSQLSNFARSYSKANLARIPSLAHLDGSTQYGALGEPIQSPPSAPGFDREYSFAEGPGGYFGDTFNEEELEMMQPGWTWALGMAVFTSVLASFQVGYNSGVLNVPQATIVGALHLSTLQWSIAVAIFCIGGLIGSMSGGVFADSMGRKNFLIANNALFICGGLFEALATSIYMLSFGRILIGIGCGGATVVVPMYLGEIAPANLRGSLGTMNQFAMVVGILIANLLGKPLGGPVQWRYLLGLTLLPALLQTILAATLLESPLWLVQQGGKKNRVYAEEVLSRLRGTDEIEFDMECLVAECEIAKMGGDGDEYEYGYNSAAADSDYITDEEDGGGGSSTWNRSVGGSSEDLFGDEQRGNFGHSGHQQFPKFEKGSFAQKKQPPQNLAVENGKAANAPNPTTPSSKSSLWNPIYRRPLMIGFGLQLAQQFSGINAVFFYSTMFFASAHMSDPWLGSVLASTVNVLATGLSIYLIERTGRRPLLLLSTGGMMLSCIGLTYALEANDSALGVGTAPPLWVGYMSIVMVLVFVAFFEIGLGPIPWLIGSEIYPSTVRTQAMGVSSTINWLSNFAVGLSFPEISLALGPMSFVPFGFVLAIALILEFIYVPETQGKSLEEIQEDFARQLESQQQQEENGNGHGASENGKEKDNNTTGNRHRRASHAREADESPIPEGKEEDEPYLYAGSSDGEPRLSSARRTPQINRPDRTGSAGVGEQNLPAAAAAAPEEYQSDGNDDSDSNNSSGAESSTDVLDGPSPLMLPRSQAQGVAVAAGEAQGDDEDDDDENREEVGFHEDDGGEYEER